MNEKRRKIWIHRFQTYLSCRIALYFVLYQIGVWSAVLIGQNTVILLEDMLGPALASSIFIVLAAAVVLLGILFIYDAVKMTHRIVGPLYRFRKTIQAVTAGEELDLVILRKDDYLGELKDDINEMLKALEQRGAVVLKAGEARQSPKQPLAV